MLLYDMSVPTSPAPTELAEVLLLLSQTRACAAIFASSEARMEALNRCPYVYHTACTAWRATGNTVGVGRR